jgi:hypothetical protein
VGSVQQDFHHVVIKIRQLFLRPAACLTSTLLEAGVGDFVTSINNTTDTELASQKQMNNDEYEITSFGRLHTSI